MKTTKIDRNEPNAAPPDPAPSSEKERRKDSGRGAEAEKPEAGAEKPKGSKKFLLILGLAGILFTAAGLGTAGYLGWISLPGLSPDKKSTPPPGPPSVGPMIKMTPLIINLRESTGNHYIKTTLVLEIGQKDWVEEVQSRLHSLTDRMILTLGDKKLEELRNPENRDELKKDLLGKANQLFASARIKQIYFDEFLFQ